MRNGFAIGNQIFDLSLGWQTKLFEDMGLTIPLYAEGEASLNWVADNSDSDDILEFRQRVFELLGETASEKNKNLVKRCLVPMSEVEFYPPFKTADYTDFYCSIYHATNVGKLFRPDNPLMPNYKWIPIGYHGRASSIITSGQDIKRPKGQNRSDAEKPPIYIPSKALDYEMEVGFFVGKGNELGETIDIKDAEEHIFGLCLVNDWSARDLPRLGISTFRTIFGQEFCDDDFAFCRYDGSTRTV